MDFLKGQSWGVFQFWFAARDLISFVARARANQKSKKANFTNIWNLFAELLSFIMKFKNYLISFLGFLSRFLMYWIDILSGREEKASIGLNFYYEASLS